MPETIESTAEEMPADQLHEPTPAAVDTPAAAASTEIEHRPRPLPTREALTPIDVDQVVAGMEAYQSLLPRLLVESDFQNAGGGKKFVKKSGWRKIARAFNLSMELVHQSIERDADGNPVRAHVGARAIAPNGQVQDGDGYCSADESRFKDAKGRAKLENDLRATATTRAKNRAISDLVGMGEVSAEEVDARAGQDAVPPWALEASAERKKAALDSLTAVLGGNRDVARELLKIVAGSLGLLPEVLVKFIVALQGTVANLNERELDAMVPPPATGDASPVDRADAPVEVHPQQASFDPVAQTVAPPPSPPKSTPASMKDVPAKTLVERLIADRKSAGLETTRGDARQYLKQEGCICIDPLGDVPFNDACPFIDHGIPF